MRAERRALRRAEAEMSIETGPGCLLCGRQDVSEHAPMCGRCRAEMCPTPLDTVLGPLGWSAKEFAKAVDMPVRTVYRAVQGKSMSKQVARRLAKLTGYAEEDFR